MVTTFDEAEHGARVVALALPPGLAVYCCSEDWVERAEANGRKTVRKHDFMVG